MNTILIAEDEKLIRKGLETMVRRATVPVEQILSARDGEEALEILKKQPVDVLITDIRMPHMDGIQLVEQAEALQNPPLVIVVSGYDDFNYAVSMLRQGVQDYLLKPVEREKLWEALEKLDQKLKEQHEERQNSSRQYLHAMRLIMLEQEAGEEYRSLVERYAGDFVSGPYRAYCAGCCNELPAGVLHFPVSDELSVYVASETEREQMEAALTVPMGESRVHQGLSTLRSSYREALSGWQRSFFTGQLCLAENESSAKPLTVTSGQLLGMLSLSWDKEAARLLGTQAECVIRGDAEPEAFARLCTEFVQGVLSTYEELIEAEDDPVRFLQLWSFRGIEDYLTELGTWLDRFSVRISQKFADYENKQKIRQAVQYMQEHFREQLNMAVVSNYVSMNYSLFSLLFKQYTGANFVSYLQDLRVKETQKLLETTDWRVNEIGRKVGFADEKHFLKVFKAATGFSPTEYRKAKVLMERKDETGE